MLLLDVHVVEVGDIFRCKLNCAGVESNDDRRFLSPAKKFSNTAGKLCKLELHFCPSGPDQGVDGVWVA